MKKIHFATIGTNVIVKNFLQAASLCEELVYEMTYSRQEETAKQFSNMYGANQYTTDLLELASSKDVDAVYIASPNSLHFEQAALMLSHGKHVLCEKTITSNEQELCKLIEIAKENQVVLMEAMRSAYEPGFQVIQENIKRLGVIRRISFQYCQYSSRYDKLKRGVIENAFQPKFSNGALMDIGVYCVHPLVRLFGLPETIQTDAIFLENGIDGAGSIFAHYDGMQAELLYSKISNSYIPSQIQGEEGSLVIEQLSNPRKVTFYDRAGNQEILFDKGNDTSMIWEIQDWVRQIQGEKNWRDEIAVSVKELHLMDKVRNQLGIQFPADEEQLWKRW